MKTGHLINSIIAVCLIFIAGNQFLAAGSLTPPAATVAPTMASLQQIFDQQRFAAFAGGTVKAGPGLIASTDPAGTGTFLGAYNWSSCGAGGGSSPSHCSLTIQNVGDCDVQLDAIPGASSVQPPSTLTVPAGQSHASTRLLRTIGSLAPLDQVGQTDGFGTYTFLGGTDCQFMWVIR